MKEVINQKVKNIRLKGKKVRVLCYDYVGCKGRLHQGGMISLDLTLLYPCVSSFDRKWHDVVFDTDEGIYYMHNGDEVAEVASQLVAAVTAIVMEEAFAL